MELYRLCLFSGLDVSGSYERIGCPKVVGSWIFLVTDMAGIFESINSKCCISLDNSLSKFTTFSYLYHCIVITFSYPILGMS